MSAAPPARTPVFREAGTAAAPRAQARPGRLAGLWGGLSYRVKIPAVLTVAILVTSLATAATLIARAYADARQELVGNAASLARTLARGLAPILLRDDVWRAYEIVVSPLPGGGNGAGERLVVVLDRAGRVYVSSDPRRLPVLSRLEALGPQWRALGARLADWTGASPQVLEDALDSSVAVAMPVRSEDGESLGTVVLAYSRSLMVPRYRESMRYVLLSTLGVLAVLLPLGWFIGNRIATPLAELADRMSQVGAAPLERVACEARLPRGGDEIGRLSASFLRMVGELKDKQALEREMIAADRLAAIGRLAAGIAHEINNPLGGMLTAVNTYRRHGNGDPLALRTLSLLERGLTQIRETVGALLVEARVESHALTPADLEDVRLLIAPEAEARELYFDWEAPLAGALALPSTPVRQVLINLLLNAVEAAQPGGRVACHVAADGEALYVKVRNGGKPIPPERLERLFEPFDSGGAGGGNGLGLWVTYQIVQQLGGEIAAASRDQQTVFSVRLPLGAAA